MLYAIDVVAVKLVKNLVQTIFMKDLLIQNGYVRELLFEPFTPITRVLLERKIEEA